MKVWSIFILNWIFVLESAHAVVIWTNPTDGQSEEWAENTTLNTVIETLAADTATTYTLVSQSPNSGKFDIQNTNELKLIAALDFETEESYTIILRADAGGGQSADITYTVTVTDVNEAPVFSLTSASKIVESGTSSGTIIYDVSQHVTDPESDTITYTITGSDLSVDENGVVSSATALNYDPSSPSITETVTANDNELTATFILTVNIKTAPQLTLPGSNTKEIQENVDIGHTVYTFAASDVDGDTTFTYSIVEQSDAGTFDVNEDSTAVVTKIEFDFESGDTSFTVTLKAVDTNSLIGTATLTVNIINVNDEDPVITSPTDPVSVPEATTIGIVVVYTVSATDDGASLSYSISNGNTHGDFQIKDRNTGQVTVAKALSFKRASVYDLEFTAHDGSQQSTQTVTFNIKTAPQLTFPDSNAQEIQETVDIGHTVYTFEASDDDGDANFTYSIVEQSDAGKFDVNEDNTAVVTRAEFDFESGDTSFTVTLKVSDTYPLTSTAVLTITIGDANDISPVFNPTSYTASLKENLAAQSNITQVTATDGDAGDVIIYSFASGNDGGLFSIDKDTGVVGTAGALDFDSGATITLEVAATDSAGNIGSTNIVVTVIQETSPVFINPAESGGSTISVLESTPVDNSVYKLSATDDDGDTLTFVFTNDNDKFDLELNQDITVAALLDYETTQSFELEFKVTDENAEMATSSATLTVDIKDVNDNPPVFTQASYGGSVLEKQTDAVTVDTVKATDADSSFKDYNVIEYSITGGNSENLFAIGASTGVITATNLNYESATSHTLEVTAKDLNGAVGAKEATVTVNVDVKTEPAWTEPDTENKQYNVDEDIAADGIVVQLAATDADNSGTLRYRIKTQTPTSPADLFAIDESAVLKRGATNLDVDAEDPITSVTLVLNVTDETYTVDRTIVININDINDNSPVFNPASDSPFEISENAAIGDSVGIVTATDDDLDETNNQITYSLSGTNFDHFTMSTTVPGQINTATTSFTSPYTLTVTASDGKNSVTVVITINVKSDPVWTAPASPGTELNVQEDATLNVYLLQSTDSDGDTPKYTIVSQSPTGPATFTLDGTTNGQINAAGLDIDASPHVTKYTLTLRVSDGTTDVASSVVFSIQDVNDNDPEFNPALYTFNVKVTADIGTAIGTVTAADDDLTATVTYSLSGTGSTDFEIDQSTGRISLKAQLDHSTTPSYSLTATANDGLTSDNASVTVNVKTAPVWVNPSSAASVSKAEGSAEVVYTISASDADSDTLTYSIKTQTVSDFFKLGGTSGRDVLLNTDNELDYETTQQYTLTFEVTDGTYDPAESAELQITVMDVNDNTPAFSSATINVIVKDTHSVGDIIKTLTATDADSSLNNNNVLTYRFDSGNDDGNFAISNSGEMTLEKVVSSGSEFTIVVQAIDGGTSPRTGEATLSVSAVNASDPVLNALAASTTHTETIAEDAPVGEAVYTIEASDSDGDILSYTIKTQTSSVKFALNGSVLEVSAALDSDTESTYTLVFEVDDDDGNTGNKLTSGTLTIMVTDVNDNYPTFPQEVYTVNIMEKQTEVVNVVKLTATDADSDKSSNGAVAYSIVGGDLFSQFTIDSSSGQLATKNIGLLRSKQKYHVIAVQAKDGGTPARADSVHVIVNVTALEDSGRSGSSKQKLCVIPFAISLLYSMYIFIT